MLTLSLTTGLLTACNNETSKPYQLPEPEGKLEPLPTPTPTATPSPSPTPSSTPAPSPSPTPPSQNGTLYNGPAEVEKYVVKFVDDAKTQGINLLNGMIQNKVSIQIADLAAYGSSTIGLCQTGGSIRKVTFDTEFWNKATETQRELLVHHELGHCVLYRVHLSTKLPDGRYTSIMYPSIMPDRIYLDNYTYYQQELYTSGALDTNPEDEITHICNLPDAELI
jgi:hypothetical protein